MWTLSPIHTGRIKASVFEVDPKVLSRNAPESIGESKHFTIASSLRGEVTATPTKTAAYLIENKASVDGLIFILRCGSLRAMSYS